MAMPSTRQSEFAESKWRCVGFEPFCTSPEWLMSTWASVQGTYIYACPHCEQVLTDCSFEYPCLPDPVCPKCGKIVDQYRMPKEKGAVEKFLDSLFMPLDWLLEHRFFD